jgi:5'-nucleotidase
MVHFSPNIHKYNFKLQDMKKILYIDMDNVLVDFTSAFPKLSSEKLNEYESRLDDVPDIFSLMEPMPGAIEAFKLLSKKFDTYILSTSPWANPSAWSDKLIWVKKYLGLSAEKRLILSHHKNLNAGDFLIDDRTKNGASEFMGEHIHFGTLKFPDWESVIGYLEDKS